MTQILNVIARPFIGSGISKRMPFVKYVFFRLYQKTGGSKSEFIIPLGLRLLVPPDDLGPGMFLSLKGEYEPFMTFLFLKAIKEGDTVYDVGAHVGYYSLLAAKKVGSNGSVISFEPHPDNFSYLKKNIVANKLSPQITLIEKAVSQKIGKIRLNLGKTSGEHTTLGEAKKYIEVLATTLDEISVKHRRFPDTIKIDTEGAGSLVLKGALKLLHNTQTKNIFIEVSSVDEFYEVKKTLFENGFSLHVIDEKQRELKSIKEAVRMLARYGFINLYAKR